MLKYNSTTSTDTVWRTKITQCCSLFVVHQFRSCTDNENKYTAISNFVASIILKVWWKTKVVAKLTAKYPPIQQL